MPMTYTSRRGDQYFLHAAKTKTGKDRFYVAMKSTGTLLDAVPEGYEIYENPDARVFLRRRLVSRISEEEVEAVRAGLRNVKHLKQHQYKIDLSEEEVTIYLLDDDLMSVLERIDPDFGKDELRSAREAEHFGRYGAMMRFVLVNEKKRRFQTERFCFLGSVDDWIPIGPQGPLVFLVASFVKHLGLDSFYELD
jgi:hypothetical protein